MLPLRYGHCDGHTDLCYSDNSMSFITCGSEGDVRVWEDINDTDQKDLCIGEKAWAVCQRGKTLYVATDKNIVQAYTFPDLEVDGIITRFTSPVTQIDISPDEKKLAAGSCDMDIHVVEMDTMESKTFSGHKAPILSISLDPRLSFLASSSCDGSVKIWNIDTGEVINQWESLVEKSNSFERASSLCRLHFEPIHGRFLAVPNSNKINIYARETWTLTKTLTHNSREHMFSVVRYSKCGRYIAGGTVEGNVFIFNVQTEKVANETTDNGYSNVRAITAISWHSKSTGVIFSNVGGHIGELFLSVPTPSVEESDSIADLNDVPLGVPDFEDDDDEDSENVISLDKIKAASGFGQDRFSPTKTATDDKDDRESIISDRLSKLEPRIPFAELQEPFQPSSTPSHLQERFLVWNDVGIVRGFSPEEGNDELDVEFHDTSLHHGFRMANSPGYNMAALTEQALVLASPRLPDMPSKLCCVLLKAWDGQKEWEAGLGTEEVIAVAAGRNWIAVATDRLLLRIYSVDGTQTDVLSIPGPLVSLAGHDEHLGVYFHTAQGRERDQYISYMLVMVDPGSKVATVRTVAPLPTTPTSTMKWVGFSDEGSPSTLDSEGFLRLLYNKQWRPICSLEDRAKGKFDHYFVLGLSEKSHRIRSILCKGAYYPPVIPKPIVNEIEWQIPLSDLDTDKGKLEEEMLRAVITVPNLLLNQDEECCDAKTSIEKTISVTVMKLFALACRTGLESRAVSLCDSMPSVDVVKLASKYAAKLGRHQLANRVADVAVRMSHAEAVSTRLLKDREDDTQMAEDDDDSRTTSSLRHQEASQDMFADHNDSSSFKNSTNKVSDKENLIMKMRKKKSMVAESLDPKPTTVIDGQKRLIRNPFRKSLPEDDDSNSTEKDTVSSPKPNYVEWFNQNKSTLQIEHPLLKDSELAIVGMKKYRQLHNSAKIDSVSSSPTTPTSFKEKDKETPNHDETEPKKRKFSDMMTESSKKKPFLTEKKSSEKKKSLSEKKPINAASKLKNFSFTKKT